MLSLPFPDIEVSARLIAKVFTHEKPARPVVLDMSEVKVLTASGLGQLITLHNRLRASGGQLVLCNVGERAYEVFEVTRLTDLLDVRRDHAEGPRMAR